MGMLKLATAGVVTSATPRKSNKSECEEVMGTACGGNW